MIKTVVYIPEVDNDGDAFTHADWAWLHAELLARFGGYSLVGVVNGAWLEEGTTYHDQNREYVVSLQSWAQTPEWLACVNAIRERFRQIALYVEVAGIPEILSG